MLFRTAISQLTAIILAEQLFVDEIYSDVSIKFGVPAVAGLEMYLWKKQRLFGN